MWKCFFTLVYYSLFFQNSPCLILNVNFHCFFKRSFNVLSAFFQLSRCSLSVLPTWANKTGHGTGFRIKCSPTLTTCFRAQSVSLATVVNSFTVSSCNCQIRVGFRWRKPAHMRSLKQIMLSRCRWMGVMENNIEWYDCIGTFEPSHSFIYFLESINKKRTNSSFEQYYSIE